MSYSLRHISNSNAIRAWTKDDEVSYLLKEHLFNEARQQISSWPGYNPTPLISLSSLAKELNISAIHYKDESHRFSLKSFKALGGAYAVLKVLSRELERKGHRAFSFDDLLKNESKKIIKNITVCCATDGNHGRSVAWAAQLFGCRSVIYLHEGVSVGREEEISNHGAEIRRVQGGYDHSVRKSAEDARIEGWFVVSDTSWEGYEEIPLWVMQGYMVMAFEILEQWPQENIFSNLFIQGGVGGLAAGVAGYFWRVLKTDRPRTIVVEPERADCIARSLAAGTPTPVMGDVDTFMACLAAAEISPLAWKILQRVADDSLVISDDYAIKAMRILANGVGTDPSIVSGESGCASVAGLIASNNDKDIRRALGLDPGSSVLVIGSEGATDPDIFFNVVGKTPQEVTSKPI